MGVYLGFQCCLWVSLALYCARLKHGKAPSVTLPDNLFTEGEISSLQDDICRILHQHGIRVSKHVAAGQPFHLDLLDGLLQFTGDIDTGLAAQLRTGVSAGVLDEIPNSGVFAPSSDHDDDKVPFCPIVDSCNWSSASKHAAIVQELIETDISEGFVEPWSGSLQDAEARWPGAVAVMKLAVIIAAGKKPRLVCDSTAPKVTESCRIPERIALPTIRGVAMALSLFRLFLPNTMLCCIVIDVKSAHKRVKVREADGGLQFFSHEGKLYRYVTNSFGARWSSYWWARVAAALTRLVHLILGVEHCLFTYVDDLIIIAPKCHIFEVTSLALALLCALGCPLSWEKVRVGPSVPYLGFQINASDYTIGLDQSKVVKIQNFLQQLVPRQRIHAKTLEKGIGLLLWASAILPALKPWLADLYANLALTRLAVIPFLYSLGFHPCLPFLCFLRFLWGLDHLLGLFGHVLLHQQRMLHHSGTQPCCMRQI